MDLGITGKVAVVAGGSRGCGRGIAEALAHEGARVVLVGRQREIVARATEEICDLGGTVHGVVADMTTEAGVADIVGSARAVFADPDILVVNSPAPDRLRPEHTRGFENCGDEDFLAAYGNFVLSQVRLVRAVLPAMKDRRWGRLLNIGTIAFKTPHQEDPLPATDAGRAGIPPLMRILAHEYGRYGITANTIATGPFDSELSRDYRATNPEIKTPEWFARMLPVGRWGEPAEMGWLAAFLCSERAAFLTGEVIRLDGGYTKSLF
jgi:3-oxoacyl-[acyl-carrier protein] reductase